MKSFAPSAAARHSLLSLISLRSVLLAAALAAGFAQAPAMAQAAAPQMNLPRADLTAGMFRIDANGALQQIDPMLQRMFGLQPQEFSSFGWMRCVHPDDKATVQKHWDEDVARGKATSLEFRIVQPDSETITYVVARNMPQFDEQGRLASQLGFVQDITQLRKLVAEAHIKDELNRQIIASSPDCTKVLDMQGRVVQMTVRGCKLVEVDDFEQVRGSDWTTWWPEEGQDLAQAALDQARKNGSARFVAFGSIASQSASFTLPLVSSCTFSTISNGTFLSPVMYRLSVAC